MSKFNQTIPEYTATVTKNIVADGNITGAGKPVLVYKSSTGWKAKPVAALANDDVLVGVQPGLSLASVATGENGVVAIGGTVTLVASDGTTGQLITAIASGGACTTNTVASAVGVLNVYGVKSAATTAYLF